MCHGVIGVGPQHYRETFGRVLEAFVIGDVHAPRTEFRESLVNSVLTVAVLVGMGVSDASRKAVANLGWRDIRMTPPVFAGDKPYAESQVLEKRQSKSRPETGRWKQGFGPGDA